jgi:hypothetical protein
MAKVRAPRFESATARLRLDIRKKSYVAARLSRGAFLLYRRCKGPGTWSIKANNGQGGYWIRALAGTVADDHESCDGSRVLSFWQAQRKGLALIRGKDDADTDAPVTLDQALRDYEQDLKTASADIANVRRVRAHLSPSLLSRPILMLSGRELRHWRDSLIEKGLANATIDRTRTPLRAALEFAAAADPVRLGHLRTVWKVALAGLGGGKARRYPLSDADILKLMSEAYQIDYQFGRLVEVLARTGARRSQAVRLVGASLKFDPPRLDMPGSRKGGRKRNKDKPHSVPVPISIDLARRLAGRPADAPLLVRADGKAWGKSYESDHRTPWKLAVERAGLDPTIGTYALRHASIVRMLKKNVPARLVAKLHDTGLGPLERNYSEFIADSSDQIARQGMLAAPLLLPSRDADAA